MRENDIVVILNIYMANLPSFLLSLAWYQIDIDRVDRLIDTQSKNSRINAIIMIVFANHLSY